MIVIDDIEAFHKLRSVNYLYIKSFSLNRGIYRDGYGRYVMTLVLCRPTDRELECLELTFTNVAELVLGDMHGMMGTLVSIEDVRSIGFEGLRFAVKETENDAFRFYCGGFSVKKLPDEPALFRAFG